MRALLLPLVVLGCHAAPERPAGPAAVVRGSGLRAVVVRVDKLE